jgi:hypothetical protein
VKVTLPDSIPFLRETVMRPPVLQRNFYELWQARLSQPLLAMMPRSGRTREGSRTVAGRASRREPQPRLNRRLRARKPACVLGRLHARRRADSRPSQRRRGAAWSESDAARPVTPVYRALLDGQKVPAAALDQRWRRRYGL